MSPVVSPGRTQSCPPVATWPKGRGSVDPGARRKPRQTQAPSHSYPAEREETHTQNEKPPASVIGKRVKFQKRPLFTCGMPEAGGYQVTVTASVQVGSTAKTQPSSDLSTETK